MGFYKGRGRLGWWRLPGRLSQRGAGGPRDATPEIVYKAWHFPNFPEESPQITQRGFFPRSQRLCLVMSAPVAQGTQRNKIVSHIVPQFCSRVNMMNLKNC